MENYTGIIFYRLIKNVDGAKASDKILKYETVYAFSKDWELESIENYITNDLALIASGGYSLKNIEVEYIFIEKKK